MLVLEDDLTGLVSGVWDAFLGLPLRPVDAPAGVTSTPGITTSVTISGGWNGSVSIMLPAPLASIVAAAMFGMAVEEVSTDEVVDAVGELANVVGGNLKGLIDTPCTLSLPMVAGGSDYTVSVPGASLQQQIHLECETYVLHVAVHVRP